ncbi:hypothetical protein SYJ56_01060 [Algoriphagus sp. D3-2-R+10]|nr:hypothetical protein [Algoriphagus sp. D3-2-R+10]MEB2773874.1 hypothetical protein [Algoriphagus sp. D3-2-R+10]
MEGTPEAMENYRSFTMKIESLIYVFHGKNYKISESHETRSILDKIENA